MELIRKGIEQGNSTSNVLQSLRWRDRYCGAMYFRETIQGRELAIQQLKNGECTGLGTGAAVRRVYLHLRIVLLVVGMASSVCFDEIS